MFTVKQLMSPDKPQPHSIRGCGAALKLNPTQLLSSRWESAGCSVDCTGLFDRLQAANQDKGSPADEGALRDWSINLSARECEVAQLVARGLSNKEIARELSLSAGTVKMHVHSIFLKLNIKKRHGLIFPSQLAT
jgi:DNA-binding CsgD family transcriptional regulator